MPSFFSSFAIIITLMFSAMAIAPSAYAEEAPVYTSWRNNLAVGGYDPVSYFSGQPLEGREEFSYTYKGAEWRFASEANLDLFKTNPEAFAPQYGGYCAWALAENKLAKGGPKHWKIVDGKLYLNFNKRIQKRWEKDIPGFIESGDQNWPTILE